MDKCLCEESIWPLKTSLYHGYLCGINIELAYNTIAISIREQTVAGSGQVEVATTAP